MSIFFLRWFFIWNTSFFSIIEKDFSICNFLNISKNLNLIKIFNISFNYLLDPSKFGSLSIAVFPGANKASLSILNDVVPMGRGFE
jgi:hypothetical protein